MKKWVMQCGLVAAFIVAAYFWGQVSPSKSLDSHNQSLQVQKPQNPKHPSSFRQAKKRMRQVYRDHQITFYCQCPYKQTTVDSLKCAYRSPTRNPRAERIEWEHIVPASLFGRKTVEWSQGHADCVGKNNKPYRGRRCARKTNRIFRQMEADMYNLVPAIGEVNYLRGNKGFSNKVSTNFEKLVCGHRIGSRAIQPQEKIKGFIARTYLYMHHEYPQFEILSKKQKEKMLAWHKSYPVSPWEIKRGERIRKRQGNINGFVLSKVAKNED